MTIPLSRTRSGTSMRLVPLAAFSTGMRLLPPLTFVIPAARRPLRLAPERGHRIPGRGAGRERFELALELPDLALQLLVFGLGEVLAGREVVVVLPPIHPDLLRL